MPFYFAYGTSLMRAQMERRLMGNRSFARAALPGFRLAFMGNSPERKGAIVNFLPDPSSFVPGALYELDDILIQFLDKAEGVEKGTYIPVNVIVEKDDREKLSAVSYRLPEETKNHGSPNLGYLLQVKQGYREWGLPEDALEKALKWSEENCAGNK